MTGVGPSIPAKEASPELKEAWNTLNMERLKPKFIQYESSLKVLDTLKKIPDPENVRPTDPESIDMLFEIPGVEPEIAFQDFVRGAAVVACILEENSGNFVRQALQMVAQRIVQGGELPAIEQDFYNELIDIQTITVNNGEPVSWRSILSYSLGAFWMLSYIKNPRKKRGQYSPLDFVDRVIVTAAQLGYVPRE